MPRRLAVVGTSPAADPVRRALAGSGPLVDPHQAEVLVSAGERPERLAELVADLPTAARVVLISSALVYGPRRDQHPLGEETPLHPPAGLDAVVDHVEAERIVGKLRAERPDRCVVLRPALGPHDGLFLSIARAPVRVRGSGPAHQFLHPEDFAGAVTWAVDTETATGVYNVAPPDTVSGDDVRGIAGGRRLVLPLDAAKRLVTRLHRLGVTALPPEALAYVALPPVLSSARLEAAGYRCRHGSADALRAGLDERRRRTLAVPAAAGLAGLGVAVWIWSRRRAR